MGHSRESSQCLIFTMLQTITLSLLATVSVASPTPDADPLLYTGHPLSYSLPYVTYHAPTCTEEVEEIMGKSCVTKPVSDALYGKRAADPQVVVGAPAVLPYHNCVNTVAEHCYPVTKVEPTTVTEKSCILKAEIECTDVVVAKIPKVTCTHEEPAVAEE